jgi:hypothetical protein
LACLLMTMAANPFFRVESDTHFFWGAGHLNSWTGIPKPRISGLRCAMRMAPHLGFPMCHVPNDPRRVFTTSGSSH